MKKIIKTLVVLLVMGCAVPVFAECSANREAITGGACSIAELNRIEKYKTEKGLNGGQIGSTAKVERDLRPVNPSLKAPKPLGDEYVLGMGLQKYLFEK